MTACCDTCGKPYVRNEMLYSIMSKTDEATGALTSFRHWECHVPMEEQLGRLRGELNKVTLQARNLGVEVGLPPRRPRR